MLREVGVPFVLIGRTADTTGLSYVDIDFDQTVRAAVGHLVGLGHRRIVYVNHSAGTIAEGYGPALRTRDAFTAAMAERGLEPLMIPAEDSAAGGRAALATALRQAPDLTAILAMNESAVFGLLGELTARGRRVPGDVSVVSMVTSPQVAELATPALTAMNSPGSALGRIAIETLLRHADAGNGEIHEQLLPCTLEVRGSSGAPRTGAGQLVIRGRTAPDIESSPSPRCHATTGSRSTGSILIRETSNATISQSSRGGDGGRAHGDRPGRLWRRRRQW